MAKKKKQTTQNQMKKKDKVKKPRREPSPAEKLAKLEYQMVKRIGDMEKLEVKILKKLAKNAKKAKDLEIRKLKRRIRILEKAEEAGEAKDGDESLKKAMKFERADKDKLKAIFMTSKGITPEAIAARALESVTHPTIYLDRSAVGEEHRKRRRLNGPGGAAEPHPAPSATPSNPEPKDSTKKSSEKADAKAELDSEEESSSGESSSESEEDSEDEENERGPETPAKAAKSEAETLAGLPLQVTEDKPFPNLIPFAERIMNKKEFQESIALFTKKMETAARKTELFVKQNAKMKGKALAEAEAAGLDLNEVQKQAFEPQAANKFYMRGKQGSRKAMMGEMKYQARKAARQQKQGEGSSQKRKAEGPADVHPSWAAKKQQKAAANIGPSGKKVVFTE